MNLWISVLVIGTNLTNTLYWGIEKCIKWQYCTIYCICNIIEMLNCLCDIDIAGPNIAR